MAGALKLFVDHVSQPSRAVMLLARLAAVPHEEVKIRLAAGATRTEEFKAINPSMQVPAIQEPDGWSLAESHAIMRYLCTTREVADHWYPADPRARAEVDKWLDWHHSQLRQGAAPVAFNKVIGPMGGLPSSTKYMEYHEKRLDRSLHYLDRRLAQYEEEAASGAFLAGATEPSIADLASACELAQLDVLPDEEHPLRLGDGEAAEVGERPYNHVNAWMGRVQDYCGDEWGRVHKMLGKVVSKAKSARL